MMHTAEDGFSVNERACWHFVISNFLPTSLFVFAALSWPDIQYQCYPIRSKMDLFFHSH